MGSMRRLWFIELGTVRSKTDLVGAGTVCQDLSCGGINQQLLSGDVAKALDQSALNLQI